METGNIFQRISIANKARKQLGTGTVLRYALYRFGLQTGHWKRSTPLRSPVKNRRIAKSLKKIADANPQPVLVTPNPVILRVTLGADEDSLMQEADEIVNGQFRRYGAAPVPIDLAPHTPLVHWTEAQSLVEGDIKDIWEPARMGWAFVLARAYHISRNELYSQTFWELFRAFRTLNPYNTGPNWASGQEVALRILALSFAWQIFHSSPETSQERWLELVEAIYEHAARIPPTMGYAQAQKNNHLITEALGLYTAGWVLQGAPDADWWRAKGQHVLNQALDEQIAEDGTYVQHSMNYHRLMLHAALWGHTLNQRIGKAYLPRVKEKLAAATSWLLAQIDPFSGRTPNLGANDGALILPLSTCASSNYRPVAQAAAQAFLGQSTQPQGCWDETSLWMGLPLNQNQNTLLRVSSPAVLRLGDSESWGTLRAVHFTDRPSQADQLHVDLWWREENIAMDAGTLRYNAPVPWDNALAATAVHNTIQIDGQDQMQRAGKFLWLDWAQAKRLQKNRWSYEKLSAEHDGYLSLNLVHRRSLSRLSLDRWLVEDIIEPVEPEKNKHEIRLHWLVPDWPFEVIRDEIVLKSAKGNITIGLSAYSKDKKAIETAGNLRIYRAGQGVHGSSVLNGIMGYHSPTYSVLKPALSIVLTLKEIPPVRILTTWELPDRD